MNEDDSVDLLREGDSEGQQLQQEAWGEAAGTGAAEGTRSAAS